MTEITQADRDAAEEHFDVWYPDTAWGYDALVDTLARHREYGYDQGYYDGRQADGAEERAKIVALAAEWMGDIEFAQFKHAIEKDETFTRSSDT